MDINPYQFKAPFDTFEWASHHCDHGSNLLVCSMAWIKSEGIVNYWAARMTPFINQSLKYDITVCISNRTGTEKDSVFGGFSCVLKFSGGKVFLMASLDLVEEGYLVVDN